MSDRSSAPTPPEVEAEEVDALPVLAAEATADAAVRPGSRELQRPDPRPLQAVVVAASGFVAGAAMAGLVHRRRRRRSAARPGLRRRGDSGPLGELVQIVGSRSLLVDVHLLSGRD